MERTLDHLQADLRARMEAAERQYFNLLALQRTAQRKTREPQAQLARIIEGRAHDRWHGEDREALEEYARRNGASFDPLRPAIPLSLLRDLTVASSGAGGYLVATETHDAVDILRPWSVVARAGVQMETGLVGNQVVPKTTAKSTPQWLPNEATQATPSQPTLAQIAMTPKQVGGVIQFSRQLAKQASAERFVRRELTRTIGTALDQAVINGSGAGGQPTGLLLTTGVQTQSGTTLNAGVRTMKQKVATANVDDERITFISTPAVRELLEGREIVTGSGQFVWQRDQVADRRAYVSTDVPAATMIAGDFGNVYVGVWGDAFVLEINPFEATNFRSGVIQARILLAADLAVLHAAAFCKAESIT